MSSPVIVVRVPLWWLQPHYYYSSIAVVNPIVVVRVPLYLQSGYDYSSVAIDSPIIVVRAPFLWLHYCYEYSSVVMASLISSPFAVVNPLAMVTDQSTWLHFSRCDCGFVAMVTDPFPVL